MWVKQGITHGSEIGSLTVTFFRCIIREYAWPCNSRNEPGVGLGAVYSQGLRAPKNHPSGGLRRHELPRPVLHPERQGPRDVVLGQCALRRGPGAAEHAQPHPLSDLAVQEYAADRREAGEEARADCEGAVGDRHEAAGQPQPSSGARATRRMIRFSLVIYWLRMDRDDPLSHARRFDDVERIARQYRLEKFNAGPQYISFVPGDAQGSYIEAQLEKLK